MKWRVLFYLLLTTASIAGAGLAVAALYRQGSSAIPHWASLVRPGELSSKHAFLADKCESCHTPTRGVEAKACISCHATDAVTLARESTAFHATIGTCSACHLEHLGDARPIATNHDILRSIGQSQGKSTLDCSACHSNRSPHRDLLGRECEACHLETTWKVAGFKHPSPASVECAQCHQAPPSHYMMGHFHMISMMIARQAHARVEQCYLCHQTDAWNDIRGVGWYKHH
jgi:hypothetical protein